jgi:hypothetical protein
MAITERIEEDYKSAFRAGDHITVSCLRILKAALKNAEISARHALNEEEAQQVVARELKQTKESLEAFAKGGRAETAQALEAQAAILAKYLPEQLSEAEVKTAIAEAVASTGAQGPQDIGKVMGAVMGKTKGRADGNAVKRLVAEALKSTGA